MFETNETFQIDLNFKRAFENKDKKEGTASIPQKEILLEDVHVKNKIEHKDFTLYFKRWNLAYGLFLAGKITHDEFLVLIQEESKIEKITENTELSHGKYDERWDAFYPKQKPCIIDSKKIDLQFEDLFKHAEKPITLHDESFFQHLSNSISSEIKLKNFQ